MLFVICLAVSRRKEWSSHGAPRDMGFTRSSPQIVHFVLLRIRRIKYTDRENPRPTTRKETKLTTNKGKAANNHQGTAAYTPTSGDQDTIPGPTLETQTPRRPVLEIKTPRRPVLETRTSSSATGNQDIIIASRKPGHHTGWRWRSKHQDNQLGIKQPNPDAG